MKKKLKVVFFSKNRKGAVNLAKPALTFIKDDVADFVNPENTLFLVAPGISGRVKGYYRAADVFFQTEIWIDSFYLRDDNHDGIKATMVEAGWTCVV